MRRDRKIDRWRVVPGLGPGRGAALCLATLSVLLVVGVVGAPGDAAAQEPLPEPEPIDIGLIEEAEVRRLFIDVEVLDEDGRPMPGLKREDFKLRLDYLWRKILTVDDLCACTEDGDDQQAAAGGDVARSVEPAAAGVAAAGAARGAVARDAAKDAARGAVAEDAAKVAAKVAAAEAGATEVDPGAAALRIRQAEADTRFVLYLDFSQLQRDGREQAIELCRDWVRNVKQPGDEAMVVAQAGLTGVRSLSGFTSDRDELLQAIDRAAETPEFEDPYPDGFPERLEQCQSGTLSCYNPGRKDYRQMKRSFFGLLGFLTRMDDAPGRKALLFFHQNATMFPGRRYGGSDGDKVPDLVGLVEEVAAAATSSRTEIHALTMGGGETWTVNFGANVSDGTGGEYNRNNTDIDGALRAAGRGCRCIYRLGVEPPTGKSRVYRVKVRARDRSLPSRYRVHYLSAVDRWAGRSRAVLTNPEDAWDLEVRAALVPVAPRGGRWKARAMVAVDLSELPAPFDGSGREWEVGVLVSHREKRKTWEMLGYARLDPTEGGSFAIHVRDLEDLPPGPYEIRAYVRDRKADLHGGARTSFELPEIEAGTVAGPWALRSLGPHRLASMPLRERMDRIDPMPNEPTGAGWAPAGLLSSPLSRGEPVQLHSWICGDFDENDLTPRRLQHTDGESPALDATVKATANGCRHLIDETTGSLATGTYEYRVRPGTTEPLRLEVR